MTGKELQALAAEVWNALVRARPSRAVGAAMEAGRSFEQLDVEHKRMVALFTVDVRKVILGASAQPETKLAAGESTPAAAGETKPAAAEAATGNGARGAEYIPPGEHAEDAAEVS